MRIKLKKALSYILAAAIMLAMIPGASIPVYAAIAPSVSLGTATLSSGGVYQYPNAVVTGSNLRTILISFSDNVTAGDEIILPAAPAGFTVSTSSSGNDYAKRINLDIGTATSDVQSYLRGVGFTIASESQSIEITVTGYNITSDTYYNADTDHYYQYIPSTTTSWTDAYTAAAAMTYMGRTGYLATITSVEEDTFVNSLSNGQTGWLGGTILSNSGTTSSAIHYSGFDTGSVVSTGWYWACGPEIGTTFYNANSLYPNANVSNASAVDNSNSTYFNWARGNISYEPNNNAGDENCLTTLSVSDGGLTNYGKHGTTFAWNDKDYSAAGTGLWDAKGYFVEYGDLTTGDSYTGSTGFASASDTPTDPCTVDLGNASWQTPATSYTRSVDLSSTARMLTISVDSGSFTVPSLGSALTFLGGTVGTNYISSFSSSTQFGSAVFSFTDAAGAETLLGDIVYAPDGEDPQTVTATVSKASPQGSDIYFGGHFYRYVSGSISWLDAALAAGATSDPYFAGRGYLATATSQPENSILLKLTDTGGGGSDHWYDAWMGGLWQRNTGTVGSPVIIRGTDGNEITFDEINNATTSERQNMLLDYTIQGNGFSGSDSSTYIHANPSLVKYYWLDGPEAGQELANNTSDFAPWHVTGGVQDEPNGGDFVYIGWQGAYWDDLSAYSSDNTAGGYAALSGYIVEFSGYDGGSTSNVIGTDSRTATADTTSPVITAGAVSRTSNAEATVKFTSNESGHYYYGIVGDGEAAPTINTGGAGTSCGTSETTVTLTSLTAGAKDFYIIVKDSFSNESNLLKIDIPEYETTDSSSHHRSSSTTADDGGAPVIVNGTSYTAGQAESTTEGGKTTTTVTVETSKLQTVLDSQGDDPEVIIPVTGDADRAEGVLTGQMIHDMEERSATLALRTDTASYTVPAAEIDIKDVAEQLGASVSLSDISVKIKIAEPSAAMTAFAQSAAENGSFSIMLPAVDFSIECTYGGKTVEAKAFNVYVQRTVLIPDDVDPAKITTGIVVRPDGTSYHVPTAVTVIDGKYYAVINSLTNSTYAVVWHPLEFADVTVHWAKEPINEMGSRMIVNGVSPDKYEPDRDITRAEFAAIIVRALGLDAGMGSNPFTDVNASDWYAGYVDTAIEYGIIKGYGNGAFGPQDKITREQAMTMIARAMEVTGLEYDETAIQQTLSVYIDGSQTSDWAKGGAAACIQSGLITGRTADTLVPEASISRAEVAVIVMRLLEKSSLI